MHTIMRRNLVATIALLWLAGNGVAIAEEINSLASEDLNSPITEMYTECFSAWSLSCVQRKTLVYLDRLGRMVSFPLLGDYVRVVRTAKDLSPVIDENDLKARMIHVEDSHEDVLEPLLEHSLDRFFGGHVLRVQLPKWSEAIGSDGRSSSSVDISLSKGLVEEGQ